MRVFEATKQTGNLDTHQVWKIYAKHDQAGYKEPIGEIFDGDIADSIVIFLNEREKVFEQNRLKKLADSSKTTDENTLSVDLSVS